MKALVLGCGLMGPTVAEELAGSRELSEVVIGDVDESQLENCLARLRSGKLSVERIDASDQPKLVRLAKDLDVVVNALPHRLSVPVWRAAIEAGVDVVDLSFEDEQMKMDAAAKKAGVTAIPGCGLAPGLSNILAGYGASKLSRVSGIRIMVGGIPQRPEPPLGYKLVYSLQTLMDAYSGKARIVRHGRIVEVPALSGLETITFSGVGELDCFYTDGLATLLYTMKNVEEMYEKTIRWPGHAAKIKTLIECGLFEEKPINVEGVEIAPRKLLAAVLRPMLELGDDRDLTVMRVEVEGEEDGKDVKLRYDLVDYFDERKGVTSMARTTGYTAALVARMLLRGEIEKEGVVPPEKAITPKLFPRLVDELAKRNIHIKEATNGTLNCPEKTTRLSESRRR